jgi:hypothetical protein
METPRMIVINLPNLILLEVHVMDFVKCRDKCNLKFRLLLPTIKRILPNPTSELLISIWQGFLANVKKCGRDRHRLSDQAGLYIGL